jgi:acyl carrier protein
VLVVQADVADAAAMASAVRQAKARFGAVHGVIHAAGEAGGGVIALKTRAAVERVFAAKLAGTRSLMVALADEPLDFLLLCSSLTSLAGGFGQSDYCAANAVLDAMATEASRQGGRHVVSVNWDAWREVGMAASHAQPDGVGITPAQGGQVLERLLAGPALPQVIVSTADLAWQIERTHNPSMGEQLATLAPVAAKAQRHARPALQTAYAEPATELEAGLAALWSEFLGISPIGIDDHLFELGGDSLMAIQLLAKVRSAYGVEVHPSVFFKTPTVAALAELVELRLIEEIEAADAAAMP